MSNPIAGCGLPAHDHQKITAGPPAPGVETDGYPNVVYYAYNGAFRGLVGVDGVDTTDALDGTWVSTSRDGGQTFLDAVRVFDPSPCKSGINGPVEVGPDGTRVRFVPIVDHEGMLRGYHERRADSVTARELTAMASVRLANFPLIGG
jgi:hypothetical protein